MEWNQLQRFLIVAKEENFSRAAQILHTSQPSLSQIIKRLEEELGYDLFVREGKRIRLNESGRIFMQTVVQMEELMQNTRIRLEELNSIQHPEVSVHFGTASTLLPQLLLYLKERNPQIQYQIHQWKNEYGEYESNISILAGPVERGVNLGNLKLGDYMIYDKDKSKTEENQILLVEDIVLALPKDHPLVDKEEIGLNDLLQEEFICLNEQWELGRETQKELSRLLFTPKMTMYMENPNMMRELLKVHLGIAFVPAISWKSFMGDEIVLRPVEEFKMSRYIYLHTKNYKYLTKEEKECVKGIKEFFAKHVMDKTG